MIQIAAVLLVALLPGFAQADRLAQLFENLARPGETGWQDTEDEIWDIWSRSGSPAMDLLLERGRTALEAGDTTGAIEHFTALVDHAPDFAEGWNARATAYFMAGLYGPSLADIRRTLVLEPRHFGALSGLGLILEETGQAGAALQVYRKVIEINPHRADVSEAIERLEKDAGGRAA